MLKYKYALDSANKIICIEDCSNINRKDDYYCISCSSKLIPIMGNIREHHFRHVTQTNCSNETYLHKTAKRLFLSRFNKSNTIFVEFYRSRSCNYCSQFDFKPCELKPKIEKHNLLDFFSSATEEKKFENFVADVLLEGNNGNLLIEFVVTHKSSEEKINSNLRIIEININDEKDLDYIRSGYFSESDNRVLLFNFRINPFIGDLSNECKTTRDIFLVYTNGRCIIKKGLGKDIIKYINYPNVIHYSFCPTSFQGLFAEEVKQASLAGIELKNCFACKHHSLNNDFFTSKTANYSIYCNCLFSYKSTNFAVNCKHFINRHYDRDSPAFYSINDNLNKPSTFKMSFQKWE